MSTLLIPSRMEAFSDGVIAVIITIMVLELKVPSVHDVGNADALRSDLKLVLVYLLSFVQTGIYWVNHHYLVDDVEQVSHGMLWSNLFFLFSLSLIPFATSWVGERGMSSFSVGLYSVCCSLPALTWNVLSSIICKRGGKAPANTFAKQAVSAALYLAAIPVAYLSPALAIFMIVAVAILWLVPPRHIAEITRTASATRTSGPDSR